MTEKAREDGRLDNGVREIEHCWIKMPDGVRLSARLWMPEGQGRYPALLEYIPYRKRDMVRARDERNHPFFAENGYVCLRVDMRGSGDSEGVMPDMYSPGELADARHVIDWIAAQPWSNGRVGMFGTSWGGTVSLQAAVDAPGPLKAVIANCATIDRFEDDIHWMGGCLLTDSVEWGATLPAILAAPPDAATVGDVWFEMWQARLDRLSFAFKNWLRHETRGDYWRHGSVRFATERLSCPVLAIGGWADRYSNSVMPLVQARRDLVWGIVGPWGHHYPDHGEPGPAIGFQQVALEWWDHWLKHDAPSVPTWPALRLWRREFDPPQDRLARRKGAWIALHDPQEPPPTRLHLGAHTLTDARTAEAAVFDVPFNIRHGECAGDTGYFGRSGGGPLDQAADDARALCFDSTPLNSPISLVGGATLELQVAADAMPAQLACRLCEVTPDGRSNLITRAVLNLELNASLDAARPFRSGVPTTYHISFPTTAYRFAKGNRIRLAIGASYWPLVWISRGAKSLQILTGGAILALPTQPEWSWDTPSAFPEPADLPRRKSWSNSSTGELERYSPAEVAGTLVYGWRQPKSAILHESIGVEISTETAAEYRVHRRGPIQVDCTVKHKIDIHRPDGTANIRSELQATGTGRDVRGSAFWEAKWNGMEIAKRHTTLDE